jgi:hypothetical protein
MAAVYYYAGPILFLAAVIKAILELIFWFLAGVALCLVVLWLIWGGKRPPSPEACPLRLKRIRPKQKYKLRKSKDFSGSTENYPTEPQPNGVGTG